MTTYSLWPSAPSASASADSSVILGTAFYSTAPGWITHVRYWHDSSVAACTAAGLYSASGTLLASCSAMPSSTATEWVLCPLDTPVAITAGTYYITAALYPSGYPATAGTFAGSVENGPLVAPNSSTVRGNVPVLSSAGNGCYVYGSALACPTSMYSDTAYYVDVLYTDTDPTGPTGSITSATSSDLTVTLAGTTSGAATVDWGEGGGFVSVTLPATHTYAAAGTYTISLASDGTTVDSTSVTVTAPATHSETKVWNGTAWVQRTVKVWDGTSWVERPVKVWNGTSWE